MIHILTNTYRVLDPWFGRARCPIELDMGCGKGRFTLALAERHPERLVLASDVMLGRLRKVEARRGRRGIANLELLRATNAELVGYQLPDGCICRLHLLCPDPWPKARHRWRRTVTTDFLVRAARVIEPGGTLHVATDHLPYAEHLTTLAACLPFLRPAPHRIHDILDLRTDFELDWLAEGRFVPHLVYECQGHGGEGAAGHG
jgi:tRNA (guanine-N7-)-methyltransferase